MKRIFALFLAVLLLTGCGAQLEETTAPPTTETVPATTEAIETVPEETEPPVIYADQIADGIYEIEVDSSASMFRVVNCILTVENGTMTAAMTMSGQGYGYVYMGTRKEAVHHTEHGCTGIHFDFINAICDLICIDNRRLRFLRNSLNCFGGSRYSFSGRWSSRLFRLRTTARQQ